MDIQQLLSLATSFEALAKKKKNKKPWSDKPEGWTEKSVDKYTKTLTKEKEHPFTECVEKIKDVPEIDNPKRFCGSIKGRMKKHEDKKKD